MNSAILEIECKDPKNIYSALIPEILDKKSERSKITPKVLKGKLKILFEAKDLNALKIVINHMIRLISAYNEAKKINGEKIGD